MIPSSREKSVIKCKSADWRQLVACLCLRLSVNAILYFSQSLALWTHPRVFCVRRPQWKQESSSNTGVRCQKPLAHLLPKLKRQWHVLCHWMAERQWEPPTLSRPVPVHLPERDHYNQDHHVWLNLIDIVWIGGKDFPNKVFIGELESFFPLSLSLSVSYRRYEGGLCTKGFEKSTMSLIHIFWEFTYTLKDFSLISNNLVFISLKQFYPLDLKPRLLPFFKLVILFWLFSIFSSSMLTGSAHLLTGCCVWTYSDPSYFMMVEVGHWVWGAFPPSDCWRVTIISSSSDSHLVLYMWSS